jgi:hypothetical protein
MKKIFWFFTLLISVLTWSCYYDTEEELYPSIPDLSTCDTSNITFQETIWPIIQLNCTGCHSGSNPQGGLTLTDYNSVSSLATSGNLVARLTGTGVDIMPPPPSNPLDDCSQLKIGLWINAGALNN